MLFLRKGAICDGLSVTITYRPLCLLQHRYIFEGCYFVHWFVILCFKLFKSYGLFWWILLFICIYCMCSMLTHFHWLGFVHKINKLLYYWNSGVCHIVPNARFTSACYNKIKWQILANKTEHKICVLKYPNYSWMYSKSICKFVF